MFVDEEYEAMEAAYRADLASRAEGLPADLYGSPTELGRCAGCGVKLGSGFRSAGCDEDCASRRVSA